MNIYSWLPVYVWSWASSGSVHVEKSQSRGFHCSDPWKTQHTFTWELFKSACIRASWFGDARNSCLLKYSWSTGTHSVHFHAWEGLIWSCMSLHMTLLDKQLCNCTRRFWLKREWAWLFPCIFYEIKGMWELQESQGVLLWSPNLSLYAPTLSSCGFFWCSITEFLSPCSHTAAAFSRGSVLNYWTSCKMLDLLVGTQELLD